MSKHIRTALYVFVGLVVLFLVVSLFLPSTVKVNRSVMIESRVDCPFDLVNDLPKWEHWSPWKHFNPQIELAYSNPPRGKEAYYIWSSDDKQIGSGRLTLVDVVYKRQIKATMQFNGKFEGVSAFSFEPEGQNTRVTWEFVREIGHNPFKKYGALLSKGKRQRMFTRALENMKKHCESS